MDDLSVTLPLVSNCSGLRHQDGHADCHSAAESRLRTLEADSADLV